MTTIDAFRSKRMAGLVSGTGRASTLCGAAAMSSGMAAGTARAAGDDGGRETGRVASRIIACLPGPGPFSARAPHLGIVPPTPDDRWLDDASGQTDR
ncbi:MAG: hypothetical protein BroJett026_40620 [Betaproteobacteria bacterium]|nr:MAG: hypothetical protein BroJett026_40620 [Betaproteobacteria bacterium]